MLAGNIYREIAVEAAKRAGPCHSAYASSKHGIDGFLEALRLELRHEVLPISVTQVPGTINTRLFDKSRTKLGVKPVGLPPIYEPGIVAEAILYAAEHPARDLVAGEAAQAMILNQRLSPRLMDALLMRTTFKLQKTNDPKPADASATSLSRCGTTTRARTASAARHTRGASTIGWRRTRRRSWTTPQARPWASSPSYEGGRRVPKTAPRIGRSWRRAPAVSGTPARRGTGPGR